MAVEIKLLGRFSVRRDGEEVPQGAYQGRLVRTLIRLLLTRRGHFVSRDTLAEALWPAQLPRDPVNNLNVLVNRARRALGDAALIRTGPGGYSFSPDEGCTVDAEQFLEGVAAARDHLSAGRAGAALRELRSALESWGDPLAEDAYEEWAAPSRSRLSRAHQEALESAAAAALALGDPAQAVAFAESAVAEEPLRELAHLLLVRSLAASGDSAAALSAFDRFRRRLVEELGIDPSAEAIDVQAGILRGEQVGRAVRRDSPPRAFAELPFVGREQELELLLRALGPGGPGIATVSGPTGSGKSRLLAELARAGGRPVLSVRAFLAERDEPWVLARSLLRAVLELDPAAARAVPERAAQALVDVVPELEEFRPVGAGTIDPESRRALTLEGGVRLVEAAAGWRNPLLLADDLQWADATSLALLRLLAQRVRALGLVVAFRPGEDPGTPPPFPPAVGGPGDEVVALSLDPLAPSAIHALVDDPGLAAAISDGTDRTPLAVAEVIRRLAREGAVERGPGDRWHARSQT
ncbi:MAG: BTAD domain-containing putative transcriptional regulator, partial [Actinomycetota bacterium]